jgi:hypothetical protein
MELDILQSFECEVSLAGYEVVSRAQWGLRTLNRWADNEQLDKHELLVPKDPEAPVRTYRPFSPAHSALFKEFAECPNTAEGIVRFADQYGLLRKPLDPHVDLARESGALRMLRLSEADMAGEANRRTGYYEDFVVHWKADISAVRSLIGRLSGRALEAGDFKSRGGAKFLNSALMFHGVGHRIFWYEGRAHEGPLPRNLAGAIWLQLAFSLVRPAEYRTCPVCQRPFEVAAGLSTGKRKNARFCSQRCKSQDFRDRQSLARTLRAQGVPIRQIAKQVVRDWEKSAAPDAIALVRSWVDKPGRGLRKGGK